MKREKSSMELWAETEIKMAREQELRNAKSSDDWKYGVKCYDSAFKAFKSLLKDGHSGISISLTRQILNRLIDGKCVTPIQDIPEEWAQIRETNGAILYQCKRMSSLFKYVTPDGHISYSDSNYCYAVNVDYPDSTYHSSITSKIIHELYPITMPYIGFDSPIKVVGQELLLDPKNGDYDTVAVFYFISPDGQRVNVNKFFAQKNGVFKQISKSTYYRRLTKIKERTI